MQRDFLIKISIKKIVKSFSIILFLQEKIEKMTNSGEKVLRNYEKREWVVRHIPVRVKGRSPRPYRIPRLWISIIIGVCLYLAVHLNGNQNLQV